MLPDTLRIDKLSQDPAKLKTYSYSYEATLSSCFNLQTTPLLLTNIINHGTRLETDSC